MTKILLTLLLSVVLTTSFGQQKTVAKFIIADGSENGADITPTLLDQNAYSVFIQVTKTA